MAFSDVQAKTTITGFSAADQAIILGAIEKAYNVSSLARTMFDDWIATPTNTIEIQYEKNAAYARTEPILLGFGSKGTGKVFLDLQFVATINYITPTGQSIELDPIHVIVHELGHALTGRVDIDPSGGGFLTDYKGANVIYTNPMLAQLGISERISYIAAGLDTASGGVLDQDFQYTNGATIDRAVSRDSDWSMSLLTLDSKDLLIGGSSANILQGNFGDDFLWGAGGDDKLYGGSGTDTAGFKGKPTDYDLRLDSGGTWTSKHVRGAVNEGTDTLTGVDKVIFEGGQSFNLKKKGLTYQSDFALVIDTTASMGDSIDAVKANGTAIINALFADNTKDARIGIIGFKDTTEGEPTSVILPFTDQAQFTDRKAAALAALNGITVDGGGDIPETAFDGLLKALNGKMGDWRPGAGVHRVVLFTDAPAKDSSLAGTVAALAANIGATITASSRAVGATGTLDSFALSPIVSGSSEKERFFPGSGDDDPVLPPFKFIEESPTPDTSIANLEIYTIYTGGSFGSLDPDLESIANTTGGRSFVAPNPADLVDTLLTIISLPPNETKPTISIANITKTEGNTGSNNYGFNLTLSNPSVETITVKYATADDTASAGTDYTATTGTVTFNPGETTKAVNVAVTGDTLFEADEIFKLNLTDAVNGTITTTLATGTIVNDDLPVPIISLAITDADAAETLTEQPANSGQFTLTRTGLTTADLAVNYAISGTAINATDYQNLTGTATFKAGSDKATIDINSINDSIYEGSETIILTLTDGGTNYKLDPIQSGIVTIADNETKPVISVANITQPEGNSGNTDYGFNLTLSNPSTETITVKYATADDTATAGSDYKAAAETVTFNPGETTKAVNIVATGDSLFEADEIFKFNLSDVVNATIATASVTGTIVNDDVAVPPVICISDAHPQFGKEGDPDAAHRKFEIFLSHASDKTITVEYATVDGTAVGGSDFDSTAPTTLTFAPGETSKTVSIKVIDDNIHENEESFKVQITNSTNATIGIGYDYGIAKIIDDDLPGISIDATDDAAYETSSDKPNPGKFTFKRTGSTTDALEVDYTIEGSAINGTDYITVDDTITFAAGSDTTTIEINPIDDLIFEGTETVTFNLADSNNYTIVGDKSEAVKITDLVLPVKNISEFVTGLQGKSEGEVIDLRGFAGQTLKVDTVSVGDAAYQNYIGFYAVEDAQGTLANGLKVGDAGYAEAAIKSAILRSFKIETQSDLTVSGGKIFAPVVIANGTFEEFLSRNPQNQANSNIHAYFNYIGANTDKVDHFRLLGANKFGVEDLYGGGDRDYNDIVVQLTVKG